jgi:hypothetical protein
MKRTNEETNWFAVIARCLAYLCLKNSKYADKSILEQAMFLEKLGLPISDRARVIGSTAESLRVLGLRKGARKNGKSKRG